MASCEATCDGECDIKCAPLVSGACYEHCIECCGGSCGAQANMDCQTSCQEVEFEQCEHELRVECDASCSLDGALFCDGEYALSGDQVVDCVEALVERGVSAQADVAVQIGNDALKELEELESSVDVKAKSGCSLAAGAGMGSGPIGFLMGLTWLVWRRRRS